MKKLNNSEMKTLLGGVTGHPTLAASTIVVKDGVEITLIDSPYNENDEF